MGGGTGLKIALCNYKNALFACKNWHYSTSISSSKSVKFGVWEDEVFKGAVIFLVGSCFNLSKPYGLLQEEVCELTRIALRSHKIPVSRIVKICLSKLKEMNPGLKLVVSYADENHGHMGKIYQAGNWIYTGPIKVERGLMIKGKLTHRRSINSKFGSSGMGFLKNSVDPNVRVIKGRPKHKYIFALDKKVRNTIATIAKPYPSGISVDSDTSGFQSEKAGANPSIPHSSALTSN